MLLRPREFSAPRTAGLTNWQIGILTYIMTSINLPLPDRVYSQFSSAADLVNQRLGDTVPPIEPKALMAFILAGYDAEDVCARWDLALRCLSGPEPLRNPVLPEDFRAGDLPGATKSTGPHS